MTYLRSTTFYTQRTSADVSLGISPDSFQVNAQKLELIVADVARTISTILRHFCLKWPK